MRSNKLLPVPGKCLGLLFPRDSSFCPESSGFGEGWEGDGAGHVLQRRRLENWRRYTFRPKVEMELLDLAVNGGLDFHFPYLLPPGFTFS